MATSGVAHSEDVVAAIDRLVLQLFAMVSEGLAGATDAFLDRDRDAARRLIARDSEFDTVQDAVEELVAAEFDAGRPDAAELAFLVFVLRIVPELERSGDLVEHIALRTAHGLVGQLTPETRGLVAAMARVGVEMWQDAAVAYLKRDADAAARLRVRDDEIDDLHVRLTAELSRGSLSTAAAIEMGLVARFYERLGDHAVNVVRRVRSLVPPVPRPAAS